MNDPLPTGKVEHATKRDPSIPYPLFTVGDKVWVVGDRKLEERTISVVYAAANQKGEMQIFYELPTKGGIDESWHNSIKNTFEEKDLFQSKKQLLDSYLL